MHVSGQIFNLAEFMLHYVTSSQHNDWEVTMNSRIPEWVKPGIWGAVFGAAAIAIVGFSAGWVVSNGSAQEMAEAPAEKAVVAAATPVFAVKFRRADQLRPH